MRRSDTWPPVLHRLVTDAELPEIKAYHLGLDLHLVELFARINPNHRSNHFGHHNHVAQVGLDQVRFLVGFCFLLCFAKFLDEAHGLAFEAAVEAATGAGVYDIAELGGGEIEESVRE